MDEEDKKLDALLDEINIADSMDEQRLVSLGQDAKAGFDADWQSTSEWREKLTEWINLAKQISEEKTFPFQGASNVKFPLLATAAMQFSARAYPSLVPSNGKIVQTRVVGKDPSGEKAKKAERVSTYMSYQLTCDMDSWEEDMDKMLTMLPIVGCMFKKTYWDAGQKKIISRIVLPENFIVNYWTKSLESSERHSEIIPLSKRVIKEYQNAGLFRNVEITAKALPESALAAGVKLDDTVDIDLVEQHTFLDLDDDGYPEPYIVTFIRETGQVLRIVPRFSPENMEWTADQKQIIRITPDLYYTKFGFVPNPDGGFYDIGFGVLIGPINEAVNTLINQLIDAGSINNLQAGFIGKGLRIRGGEMRFKLGEWKAVNGTGDDLRKQIVPLPTKEPSKVLLELMGILTTSGKELASVAEIFVGKMPGQNTPATTTMASIEQGMKVFTAVYKRIYRALGREFYKLFDLNKRYLDENQYRMVLDEEASISDFDKEGYDVCPGADPTAVSQTEKLLKAQGLMELLPTGILDPVKVVSRVLEAQEQPDWEDLLNEQVKQTGQFQPPPDPKLLEMQMKGQLEQQKVQLNSQAQQQKMELEARDKQTQLAMKQQEHVLEMQNKQQAMQLDAAERIHKQRIFSAEAQAKLNQSLVQSDATHQQKLQQMRDTQKAQPKKASNSNK